LRNPAEPNPAEPNLAELCGTLRNPVEPMRTCPASW
jgi:hypothetical protein